jgi:hypothetical protein
MKLSVLTIVTAAALATASVVPSCDRNTDINEFTFHTTKLICTPICFLRKPKCHPPYKPRKVPHCWRCCKPYRASSYAEIEEFDDEELDYEVDA